MDQELKAKWVAALRGGEYRQATGRLQDQDGFCCLGVLCMVAGAEIDRSGKWAAYKGSTSVEDTQAYLPFALADEIGLSKEPQYLLARMNDGGARFAEIADYIEQNL